MKIVRRIFATAEKIDLFCDKDKPHKVPDIKTAINNDQLKNDNEADNPKLILVRSSL